MQILTEEEFLKLNASGLDSQELATKLVRYNNVDLTFHQQPPGKIIELLLGTGEAVKGSLAINLIVEAYFPQLKGRFSQLTAFAAVEIVMLILQEGSPGGLPVANLEKLGE